MFIETVKTEGIAHLSYVVTCDGQAGVIDPQLDFVQYIELAAKHNCRITHIFETHRNEDFISGAVGLAKQTGACVYHGEHADQPVSYANITKDGDTFSLGSAEIKVLATPGHTKDSICLALADTNYSNNPIAVFTGDTLFVSDVGRTDFYPGEKKEMASSLYDSLEKLMHLGDEIQVYPAHGAGSVCGGGMADREFTTIGYERKNNPMLNKDSKEAFVETKIKETHYYAPYFETMEESNVKGVEEQISQSVCQPLTNQQKEAWLAQENRPGIIVDVRSEQSFREGHLRGSLCFPGSLLSAYAGWVLPYNTELLIVSDDHEQAQSAHMQLSRMGYFDCVGYISAIPARAERDDALIDSIDSVSADEVQARLSDNKEDWILLDVRKADEVTDMPLPGAIHAYLGFLAMSIDDYNPNLKYTCMCGSDKRATVAASILKRNGIHQVDVFEGSFKGWMKYQK